MANGIGENKINKQTMGSFVKGLVKEGKVSAQNISDLGKDIVNGKITERGNDISKDEGPSLED